MHQSLELEPHGVHNTTGAPPRLQGAFHFWDDGISYAGRPGRVEISAEGSSPWVPPICRPPTLAVRLREFFLVEDDDDKSNGIPIPAGDDEDTPDAGSGDLSNGVPSPIGAQGRKMRSAGQASAKNQMVPTSQQWAGKYMDI